MCLKRKEKNWEGKEEKKMLLQRVPATSGGRDPSSMGVVTESPEWKWGETILKKVVAASQ